MKRTFLILICLFIFPVSANSISPKVALEELDRMNIEYSEKTFVNAARAGDIFMVELFLDGGMEQNQQALDLALSEAEKRGHIKVVELLKSKGAQTKAKHKVAACRVSYVEYPESNDEIQCGCTALNAYPGRGSVYGTSVYTGDSDICLAASHAGALGSMGGKVTLKRLPGWDSYMGSYNGGVQSLGLRSSYRVSFCFPGYGCPVGPVGESVIGDIPDEPPSEKVIDVIPDEPPGEEVKSDFKPEILLTDNFDKENKGRGQFNYKGFEQWDVTRGEVDVAGNGFYDVQPGKGLFLDLDGSASPPVAGTLQSKRLFHLRPGNYLLKFDLGGNPYESRTNTVTVRLGEVFVEDFTLPKSPPHTPFKTMSRTIRVLQPVDARLVFQHHGGDLNGLFLDNVQLTYLGTEDSSDEHGKQGRLDEMKKILPPADAAIGSSLAGKKGLSADQLRIMDEFGSPDTFELALEPDVENSGKMVVSESWRYFNYYTSFEFIDGKLLDGIRIDQAPDNTLPASQYSPQDFSIGMSLQEAKDTLGNAEPVSFNLPDRFGEGLEIYTADQILLGFADGALEYVTTLALAPGEKAMP